MAEMTLAEAQAQLSTVNIAIQDIIQGKRLNELKVGSGDFARTYIFTEISIENLTMLRNELRNIINSLQPTAVPIFRTNANIPLVVGKV